MTRYKIPINPSKKHQTSSSGICNIKRIKTYPIELIFDYIIANPVGTISVLQSGKKHTSGHYVDEDGNECKLRRARIFFEMGIDCVSCSTKAKFFALEQWVDKSYHFDLYGIDSIGDEVLMTIDHIHAKSNGGKDHISNFAPMCKCCNEIKSNS